MGEKIMQDSFSTAEKVLSVLAGAGDAYVSGEEASRSIGVSRQAVNMAVQTLRADGYEIESSTNKGYRLAASPDDMSRGALLRFLTPERALRVRCERVLPSTNSTLMNMLQEDQADDGQTVIADRQTSGRGRIGKTFASPGGMGIYLSYLIRPDKSKNESAAIGSWLDVTCRTAVAVTDAINDVYGVMPDIKWVNDLYLNRRKLCGILTQTDLESETGMVRGIIIGIGVNVCEHREDFPKELQDIATSLYAETGAVHPRAELAAAMIHRLDELRTADPAYYLEEYRRRCPLPGKKLILKSLDRNNTSSPDLEEEVTALSISDSYGLVVRRADGTERELRGEEIIAVPGLAKRIS